MSYFRRLGRVEALGAAAILAGLILRFYRIEVPLWLDEALTLEVASRGLSQILPALLSGQESNPPLMYFLVHIWMGAFGGSDIALHALTACIGVLGVLVVLWAGARSFGLRAGFAAAALLALHPLHLAHSQELRPYGLLVLLSAASFGLLSSALGGGRAWSWCGYALVSLANCYTHYYALFVVLGQAAAAAAGTSSRYRSVAQRRAALLAFAAVIVGFLPGTSVLWTQAVSLAARTPYPKASLAGAAKSAVCLSGAYLHIGAAVVRWPEAFMAAVSAFSLWLGLRSVRALRASPSGASAVLLASIAAGLALPLVVSLRWPIYLPDRHAIVALPFLCILCGAGLQSLRGEGLRAASLSLILGAYALTLRAYFSSPKSYDADIAGYLELNDRPCAVFMAASEPGRMLPVARYYPAALRRAPEPASCGERPRRIVLVRFEGRGGEASRPRLLADRYRPVDGRDFGSYATAEVFVPD